MAAKGAAIDSPLHLLLRFRDFPHAAKRRNGYVYSRFWLGVAVVDRQQLGSTLSEILSSFGNSIKKWSNH